MADTILLTWTRVAFSSYHWLSGKFADPGYGEESKIKMRKKLIGLSQTNRNGSESDFRCVLRRIHEAFFFHVLRYRVKINSRVNSQ